MIKFADEILKQVRQEQESRKKLTENAWTGDEFERWLRKNKKERKNETKKPD